MKFVLRKSVAYWCNLSKSGLHHLSNIFMKRMFFFKLTKITFFYFFLASLVSYYGYVLQLCQQFTVIFRNFKTTITARFKEIVTENRLLWLYVLIMSSTSFRLNLQSISCSVWLNGWVFAYKLSRCGFEYRCSHL